jgi:DNA topoisomerase I
MKIFIVESPGKIKKIASILGAGWKVMASYGHINELSDDGDDRLGFQIDGDKINCRYVSRSDRAKVTIASLKSAVKGAEEIILASDPDREGETIAWHLANVLGIKNAKRVVYQSITAAAINQAVSNPGQIDQDLVAAGRCRGCLDKLVGYKGSKLIQQLNNGAKSVGRVQSSTLHLICDRERKILDFRPEKYWSIFVDYSEGFRAFLAPKAKATKEDIAETDEAGAEVTAPESIRVTSQEEADRIVAIARNSPHNVEGVEFQSLEKSAPPPFTTSALQQVAGAKLGYNPDQTMRIAQKLYESGLITYMRTDSSQLSDDCVEQGRRWLSDKDLQNLPIDRPSKNKNSATAQEGHEAIRPTDFFRSSQELKQEITDEEFNLYLLIWKRAMAFLCKSAVIQKTVITTRAGETRWIARGQTIDQRGYLKYWDNLAEANELPAVTQEQLLNCGAATAEAKMTQPPTRMTEAQLVQAMERKGIGRPSTYASTVGTLKERNYVELDKKKKLHPTGIGMEVDGYLAKALPDLIDPSFTAEMESSLDKIAAGKLDWEKYLSGWSRDYFSPALQKATSALGEFAQVGKISETCCPQCQQSMVEAPFPKSKSSKKYFLKCGGCKVGDRSLAMFWSDRQNQWQLPQQASEMEITDIPCGKCQNLMSRIPSEKVSGGFYVKCVTCKDSVMFWDDRSNQWAPPKAKKQQKTPAKAVKNARSSPSKPKQPVV